MTDTRPPLRILVTAGSKHGATREIAERIALRLRTDGFETSSVDPEDVGDLQAFDAVILGSAIYAGRWRDDAKYLADRLSSSPEAPPVWLFSSGPLGDPLLPDEDPADAEEMIRLTGAREHRIFPGKIDKSLLGFGERAIMRAVRAPDGDFRDWDEIGAWVDAIADELMAGATT